MKSVTWRRSKDPLFRGDSKMGVALPTPTADDSIVRHVLYLEGPGRGTPYLSTSEKREAAELFAQSGAVWRTYVAHAEAKDVRHISNSELLGLMRGNGLGKAKWPRPYEVMTARRYVEQWGEHLLDFRKVRSPKSVVEMIFVRS